MTKQILSRAAADHALDQIFADRAGPLARRRRGGCRPAAAPSKRPAAGCGCRGRRRERCPTCSRLHRFQARRCAARSSSNASSSSRARCSEVCSASVRSRARGAMRCELAHRRGRARRARRRCVARRGFPRRARRRRRARPTSSLTASARRRRPLRTDGPDGHQPISAIACAGDVQRQPRRGEERRVLGRRQMADEVDVVASTENPADIARRRSGSARSGRSRAGSTNSSSSAACRSAA